MAYRLLTGFVVLIVGAYATAAVAAPDPDARLVSCGGETCLRVSGHRDNVSSQVVINGHPVAVEGKRSWHVRLPLSTVRTWSELYARSIEVTLAHPDGRTESTADASLPIGLLGHRMNLAALIVRAR